MKSLKEYIDQATTNINEDRAATKSLLMNLMKYMQNQEDRHKEVGIVAAKYLETLQRSNDQLVRLASLLQKRDSGNQGMTEEDKKEIFDMIQGGENE
jgi:hypothetical protein